MGIVVNEVIASSGWVEEQRDRVEWSCLADGGKAQAAWRHLGFSIEEAADWFDQLSGLESKALSAEECAQLAAGWVVAGFSLADVPAWFDCLPHVGPVERAMVAREWRESGFTARSAQRWASREDVTVAVLLENGGWHPRQRDLLDLLLLNDERHLRVALISAPVSPAHVLDYVKAGLALAEFAAYENQVRQRRPIQAVLRDLGKRRTYSHSLAFRLDAVIAELPAGSTGYHVESLFPDAVDPTACDHEPLSPLPPGYDGPQIVETWSDRGLAVWTRGAGEWMEGGVPGDYAYVPILGWSESDQEVVRVAFSADLEEGESCEVSWPPRASLWTEGSVSEPDLQGCDAHESFDPMCLDCPVASQSADMDPAEWRWYVGVEVFRPAEDDDERFEVDCSYQHILTTRMDPRAVEYSESGPLR